MYQNGGDESIGSGVTRAERWRKSTTALLLLFITAVSLSLHHHEVGEWIFPLYNMNEFDVIGINWLQCGSGTRVMNVAHLW